MPSSFLTSSLDESGDGDSDYYVYNAEYDESELEYVPELTSR